MCMFCVEIAKGSMTTAEVARAYREFNEPDNHFADVLVTIANHYDIDEVSRELSKLYKETE